jgi:hypothetical protein
MEEILSKDSKILSDYIENRFTGYYPEDVKEYNQSMHPNPPLFPTRGDDSSMFRRNEMWAARLRHRFFTSAFDEGFMFVGAAHLPGLFRRLESDGCRVAPVSLADYQEFTHSFTSRDTKDFHRFMHWWNPSKFPGATA